MRSLFFFWLALALVAVLVIAGQIARAATPVHAIDHGPVFSPTDARLHSFARATMRTSPTARDVAV